MSGHRAWIWTPALVAGIWLMLASAAWSHGGGGAVAPGHHLKLDPTEVAELGVAHAREHANGRRLERMARERWKHMTPRQRRQRQAAAERRERRLNRKLAVQSRDDIGFWGDRLIPLPDYAIHASMMPTGELLIFGREPLRPDGTRLNLGSAAIFDPKSGAARPVPPPPVIAENGGRPAAIYCSGQALLSDGRVLLVGGNLAEPDAAHGRPQYSGLKYTFLFDPWTETWQTGPQMKAGRWYPTAVKLASGDILVMSGYDEHAQGAVNQDMELYRPNGAIGTMSVFPGGFRGPGPGVAPGAAHPQSLYPRMFTLPDGDVALASPGKEDSAILDTPTALDPSAGLGSAWTQLSTGPSTEHYGGAAVLEPQMGDFGGSWRVLVAGGTLDSPPTLHLATNVVERLDAAPGTRAWQATSPLNEARHYLNNVLLPDGGMVTVGGGSGIDNATTGNYYIAPSAPPELRQVELRRPGETTWRLGAAQQEWRTYHSTASLLPDGRVFSGGDDYHEGPDPFNPLPDSGPGGRRDSAEIYWPPYLFNGDSCAPRPAIRGVGSTAAPAAADAPWATLTYGETFGIFSEHARAGMQATLVAPSEVTHSFDMNQRVVPLQITSTVTAGGLNAETPANANIAPPGWYMLFVIDADGTPSISRWVRLLPAGSSGLDATVATVTGAWPNPTGRSCVNPDGTTISEPAPTPPAPAPPPPPPAPAPKLTAKLGVNHARIIGSSRKLDVLANISEHASGTVAIELVAGGLRTSFKARIDSAKRRIAALHRIAGSQARLGTGIVTINYAGDADTRAQSVRLRAARHAARLKMTRPKLTSAGHLKAAGTISTRARGVVRLQLQFDHDGKTRTVQLRAHISHGAWKLDEQLSPDVREQIAQRSGTLHSYTLFTGDKRAEIRGEMRSYEVLGTR